ncbi:hypothetical protein TVAG_394760 [Trichomonas vaginalis G3]|uniref:Uncharacterized protein n=1 Tax=Trichomonas vaginalis (strain ATCC PRA-98 / G3) TaxID=412133 RepID=A2EDE0_TRIV3|nr:hypothetical protein TVAGG3_0725490 [Trichomonas vaginalis G3]EAY09304.1 hypothetical protein TVAG_394760 [Trichomonas vaginalis G3]KAI5510879.1 hypothetical protein TVAGG3_0725490 [Trichomonas vaginalis G3]|eukprot:XP_001321527.1 hypothetical protein [Trichomonas vaginalis G3]
MSENSTEEVILNQDEEDELIQMGVFYDKKINHEKLFLRKNLALKTQLESKLEELQNELDAIEEENSEFEANTIDPDTQNFTLTGDFFEQLRILEGQGEIISAKLAGIKAGNVDLQAEVQSNVNKTKILRKQNTDLEEKVANLKELLEKRKVDIRQIEENYVKVTTEEEQLKLDCIQIKEDTRKKAEDLKAAAKAAAEDIFTQRQLLITTIAECKQQLDQIKEVEKGDNRSSFLNEKKRISSLKEQSSSSWMNERISLVNKIKLAKEKLVELSRHTNVHSRKNVQLKSPILKKDNLSDSDIKKALFLEINELKGYDWSFIDESIKAEKSYAESLQKELDEINQFSEKIEKFSASNQELIEKQNNSVENNRRLDLLKQELNELKSQL